MATGPTYIGNQTGNVQGAAVASVASADAGGTYTAAEQALINEMKAQLNALLTSQRDAGIIET